MLPHQERVVEEKQELDGKIERLQKFIGGNDIFPALSEDIQGQFHQQLEFMQGYSEILGTRISQF